MKENKICKQLLTNFLETWKMSENDLHDMTKRKQIFTNFWSLPVLSFCWPIGMWYFNWQWTRFAKFYWTRSSWIQRGWFEIIFDCMELSFVSHKAITNFQFLRTWTNTKFFCHDFWVGHVSITSWFRFSCQFLRLCLFWKIRENVGLCFNHFTFFFLTIFLLCPECFLAEKLALIQFRILFNFAICEWPSKTKPWIIEETNVFLYISWLEKPENRFNYCHNFT